MSYMDPLLMHRDMVQPVMETNFSHQIIQPLYSQMSDDYIDELQRALNDVDEQCRERLMTNAEYVSLSNDMQNVIQNEMLNVIKLKLNTNSNVVSNVKRQIDIIKSTMNDVKMQRENDLNELNDYIKNYSSLTFDEYRELKHGDNKKIEITK